MLQRKNNISQQVYNSGTNVSYSPGETKGLEKLRLNTYISFPGSTPNVALFCNLGQRDTKACYFLYWCKSGTCAWDTRTGTRNSFPEPFVVGISLWKELNLFCDVANSVWLDN